MAILVDADILVALAKIDDSNHQKAVIVNNSLQTKGTIFYFSPFTIAEAVTVISYKVNQLSAKKLLYQLRKLDLPTLFLPESDNNIVDKWFSKQATKGTSYFDCYNMALMEHYSSLLQAIFSFDSIYRKNGFKTAK